MKRIIDGRTYNTDTATKIAVDEWRDEVGQKFLEVLYQTRGGAFFGHRREYTGEYNDFAQEEVSEDRLIPYTREQAEKWIAVGQQVKLVSPDIFAEPPEAESSEQGTTVYMRIPRSLKDRIAEAADKGGASVNSWMIRCAEECLDPRSVSVNVYVTAWPNKNDLPVQVDENGIGYELAAGPSVAWNSRELVAQVLLHPQALLSDVVVGLRRVANDMVDKPKKFQR